MTPAQQKELRDCLELMVQQVTERCINLRDADDLLCAVDKQTVNRAKKALRDTN